MGLVAVSALLQCRTESVVSLLKNAFEMEGLRNEAGFAETLDAGCKGLVDVVDEGASLFSSERVGCSIVGEG